MRASQVTDVPLIFFSLALVFCFLGGMSLLAVLPRHVYTRAKLETPAAWAKAMVIPLAFVANIGLNNLSLKFTTLGLNQLVRAFSPVSIAITSYLIERKVQSWQKQLSLAFLVGGVAMGVATSPDFEFLGFLLVAGSVIGQSIGIVMMAYVMAGRTVNFHVVDIMLYCTLPSTLVLFPWAAGMGEFKVLEESVVEHGFGRIMGLVTLGGLMSFTYQMLCTIFIKATSSVYYGVTGGFRCSLAIIISFFVFPQKISALSVTGIGIAMIAFTANSYFTMKEKLGGMPQEGAAAVAKGEKASLLGEGRGRADSSEHINIGAIKRSIHGRDEEEV